jgi:hypothetical protein
VALPDEIGNMLRNIEMKAKIIGGCLSILVFGQVDAMTCRQWQNLPHALLPQYHSDLTNEWYDMDQRCHPSAYDLKAEPDTNACTALVMIINKLQAAGCGFGTADGWWCPPPGKHCAKEN